MKRPSTVLLALLLTSVPFAAAPPPGFVVIVNGQSAVGTLSTADLSLIFLKRKTQWPDGKQITLASLPDGSAASVAFDHDVLAKSPRALRAYWQQEIFSGRSVPPVEKADDEELVSFVRRTAGAIGYVSATTATTDVKVVKVTQ